MAKPPAKRLAKSSKRSGKGQELSSPVSKKLLINEQDLMGKPFLVFFGYTHCPDVCHTTLFEMSEILRALGPNAKINALFVTVDPERDSAEVLKDYLSNFDSRIIGVTGPRSQLEPMLREYRIYAKRAPGNNIDYAVDHTTVVYLMDKNGHFVTPFNVSRRPYDAAHEIEKYL
jgi:protein SCO1/2